MKKKILAAALAAVLCIGVGIGGTLAWLTANSGPVVNTFTSSDINITLAETKKDFQMVPGHTIDKDPKVTVETGSEDCWLFVKIDKSSNYDTYLDAYVMADGWQEVEEGVYGRKVLAADMGTAISVLKNDQVTVKTSVTKADMEAIKASGQPTLTFTAYAVQLYSTNDTEFTAAQAWANRGTTAPAT